MKKMYPNISKTSRQNNILRCFLFSVLLLSQISTQLYAQITATKSVSTPTIDLEKLIRNNNNDYVITSEHISSISGIHHKYLRQAIDGMEIYGTDSSIHIDTEGKVVALHNNFVGDISSTLLSTSASLSAEDAIRSIARQKGYSVANLERIENLGGIQQKATFNKAGISGTDIPAKLMYYYRKDHGTQLVWEISIQELNSSDWWNFRVDATSGTILDKDNFTAKCVLEGSHDLHKHTTEIIDTIEKDTESAALFTVPMEESTVMVGSYNVFAMPIETPNHGGRSLVLNPDNATASPFGWHDTNGAAGAEFTYTRGNNCDAYDDDNNTNSGSVAKHADGGGSLIFDFPLNTTYSAGNQSEDAAVTNLFYWTNIIHDVTYQYGFDEASGNFQENNYGNGGSASDGVNAEAQDGSGTCNANFGTPNDGGNPRMQMYVCADRDGDFDNGVIVHEYGHGISNRLTGGRFNSSCLTNTEQMGEGWSDFFALILTMEPGDQNTDVRGIGTWLTGEDETGTGIRTFAYSTNFGVNSLTYDDVNSEAIPHGVGSVWAAMLWEMTWELIDDHGFSTDIYTFTGNANTDAGNVQALALVMEGLKLQPCSPGIEDGRDAILQADLNIYGGANQCAIWEAFARRGMGASADQGLSSSVTDGTPAFDLPTNIAGFDNSISNACLNGGILTGLTGGFPAGGTYSGVGVSNTGGNTYSFNPLTAGVGTHDVTYTVNDFCNGNSSTAFIQTIDVQDDVLSLTCPSDLTVESDSNSVCSAQVVFNYPTPEGDLCDRTSALISQNTNPTINSGLDCTDAASGHLRSFSLGAQGITRDYHIDGIDIGINNNAAGISPITVNIYLASQVSGGISGKAVPLSGAIEPFASATSLVPAGSDFTHNVPMEVFLPAGSSFHVEVISPSSRNNMVGYNNTATGNPPANETAVGYINCVGADYLALTSIGFGNLAVLIEVTGAESNEFTTTQTAGLTSGSIFPAGKTTNTFMTSAQSGGSTSCSFDVNVIGKTTIYSGGIWSPVAPDVGSNVKFSENYTTSSGDITACSCEVDPGATVTVAAGDYMDIFGLIDVNGSLIVEHQGSVVQTDDNAIVTNNGTINVLLDTPTMASRDFLILGSPMTGETRGSVWGGSAGDAAFLVLDQNTPNFVPHPQVAIDFPGAENFADDNNDFWLTYPNAGTIDPAEGYLVRPQLGYGQPGGVFSYTYNDGTLHTGDITFPVLYNTPGPTAADNKNASPNVLSNPYPSAIFADDFINANSMVGEVFFWEHLTPPSPALPGAGSMNFSMEDISMYNLSGGIGAGNPEVIATRPNGYISTGQGFGIKASAAGTANFTNAMRRVDNNNTLRNSINKDRIWITVESDKYEVGGSTLISFNDIATAGLDVGYDSRRLATIVSLYSHLEDGSEQFGIQTREAFQPGIKVPLGFSSQVAEEVEYTISISTVEGENLESATVYLIDNETNGIHNLSDSAYTFTSNKGTFHNRFTVQFEGDVVLGIDETRLDSISLFPNPTQGNIQIFSPIEPITQIMVYDLRGRELKSIQVDAKENVALEMTGMESAVYFVKITTDLGSITKRVIKK